MVKVESPPGIQLTDLGLRKPLRDQLYRALEEVRTSKQSIWQSKQIDFVVHLWIWLRFCLYLASAKIRPQTPRLIHVGFTMSCETASLLARQYSSMVSSTARFDKARSRNGLQNGSICMPRHSAFIHISTF
eukprot:SAG31_NODE_1021_length_10327_cov_17.940653_5_plen_131_part_00